MKKDWSIGSGIFVAKIVIAILVAWSFAQFLQAARYRLITTAIAMIAIAVMGVCLFVGINRSKKWALYLSGLLFFLIGIPSVLFLLTSFPWYLSDAVKHPARSQVLRDVVIPLASTLAIAVTTWFASFQNLRRGRGLYVGGASQAQPVITKELQPSKSLRLLGFTVTIILTAYLLSYIFIKSCVVDAFETKGLMSVHPSRRVYNVAYYPLRWLSANGWVFPSLVTTTRGSVSSTFDRFGSLSITLTRPDDIISIGFPEDPVTKAELRVIQPGDDVALTLGAQLNQTRDRLVNKLLRIQNRSAPGRTNGSTMQEHRDAAPSNQP